MARIDAHKPSALIPTNYAFIAEQQRMEQGRCGSGEGNAGTVE